MFLIVEMSLITQLIWRENKCHWGRTLSVAKSTYLEVLEVFPGKIKLLKYFFRQSC